MKKQGPSWQEQRRQTIKLLKENGYGKNTMEHVVANETHKLLKVYLFFISVNLMLIFFTFAVTMKDKLVFPQMIIYISPCVDVIIN